MELRSIVSSFILGLTELHAMVQQTEQAVIGGNHSNVLITNNVNFYTKSFLISACAHLEMCIKELVFEIARDIDRKLSEVSVLHSIIEWRLNLMKKTDSTQQARGKLAVKMTKKEVDDLVSGNVFRTKDALAVVGIDIDLNKTEWEMWKETIQAIVTRRNNIVHHNDDASDLSLGDIKRFINSINQYIEFLINCCEMQHGTGEAGA